MSRSLSRTRKHIKFERPRLLLTTPDVRFLRPEPCLLLSNSNISASMYDFYDYNPWGNKRIVKDLQRQMLTTQVTFHQNKKPKENKIIRMLIIRILNTA